jgi:hypothetical protein
MTRMQAKMMAEARYRLLFRLQEDHEESPEHEHHEPAHRSHVVGQVEEGDLGADDVLVEAYGHGSPGGAQEGDDAARAGDVGHADEHPLAEPGGSVILGVEVVDGDQQGVHGGGHGRVGHDVGQGRGDHEAPEVDHAGLFPHDGEHLVGEPAGQSGLGEDHADDQGREDEEHRRVHEVLESLACRPDHEEDLEHADGQAGHPDGDHLEDPPDAGQEKDREGPLALGTQDEMFARGIHGVGPGWAEVDAKKEDKAKSKEKDAVPVYFGTRCGKGLGGHGTVS